MTSSESHHLSVSNNAFAISPSASTASGSRDSHIDDTQRHKDEMLIEQAKRGIKRNFVPHHTQGAPIGKDNWTFRTMPQEDTTSSTPNGADQGIGGTASTMSSPPISENAFLSSSQTSSMGQVVNNNADNFQPLEGADVEEFVATIDFDDDVNGPDQYHVQLRDRIVFSSNMSISRRTGNTLPLANRRGVDTTPDDKNAWITNSAPQSPEVRPGAYAPVTTRQISDSSQQPLSTSRTLFSNSAIKSKLPNGMVETSSKRRAPSAPVQKMVDRRKAKHPAPTAPSNGQVPLAASQSGSVREELQYETSSHFAGDSLVRYAYPKPGRPFKLYQSGDANQPFTKPTFATLVPRKDDPETASRTSKSSVTRRLKGLFIGGGGGRGGKRTSKSDSRVRPNQPIPSTFQTFSFADSKLYGQQLNGDLSPWNGNIVPH